MLNLAYLKFFKKWSHFSIYFPGCIFYLMKIPYLQTSVNNMDMPYQLEIDKAVAKITGLDLDYRMQGVTEILLLQYSHLLTQTSRVSQPTHCNHSRFFDKGISLATRTSFLLE